MRHLPNGTWLLKLQGFTRLSLGLTCNENSSLHSVVESTRRMMSDESAVFYVLFLLPFRLSHVPKPFQSLPDMTEGLFERLGTLSVFFTFVVI